MWLLLARVLLGAFFLASGLAKVTSPGRNADAAQALGIPAVTAPAVGYLLPAAEIGCGAGLIVTPSAAWAAGGAVVLLAAFSALLAANLLTGRHPACGCFGSLSRDAIGWPTLTRNLVLMAMAATIVAAAVTRTEPCRLGCFGAVARRADVLLAAGLATESLVLAALIGLVIRLTLQAGRVQLRLAALESAAGVGHPGPAIRVAGAAADHSWPLPGEAGGWLDQVTVGALVFVADNCGACDRLLAELGAGDSRPDVPALLVTPGSAHPGPPAYAFVSDHGGQLRRALAVHATPTAVLCDARQGVLRRAQGLRDVRALLGAEVRQDIARQEIP